MVMNGTIFIRRSIRKFLDKPIDKSSIERIISAGMHAPSAMNTRPWEFLVLTTPEKRAVIARMSPYSKQAEEAPVIILTLVNTELEKEEGWYAQDMSACTQNILLQIVEEGFGGVWFGIYPIHQRIKNLQRELNLPENLIPFSAIPFGFSERTNKSIDRYEPEKVHYNEINNK
jgi:nitroreductase